MENRKTRIRPGWYLLHTGGGKIQKELEAKLLELVHKQGNNRVLSEKDLPHSVITGLIHISYCLEYSQLLKQIESSDGAAAPLAQ